MSFQTIIDNATFINIDKRKTTAMSVSRSGHIKTAERQPSVYKFTVGSVPGLKYSTNRGVLEDIDSSDRVTENTISLNNNTGMNYLTALQGTGFGGTVTVTSASGNEIVLDTTSATGADTVLKKGDFIQLDNSYRYPYQVTADVTWHASSITVPIHRGFLTQTGYTPAGKGILLGNNVTFKVKAMSCPTYSIVPHDRIEFAGDFEFVEIIT